MLPGSVYTLVTSSSILLKAFSLNWTLLCVRLCYIKDLGLVGKVRVCSSNTGYIRIKKWRPKKKSFPKITVSFEIIPN